MIGILKDWLSERMRRKSAETELWNIVDEGINNPPEANGERFGYLLVTYLRAKRVAEEKGISLRKTGVVSVTRALDYAIDATINNGIFQAAQRAQEKYAQEVNSGETK
ncbi:MAG: hypothetical protein KKF56_04515 [Nanoarchaeota archaeon]|nr:hypothetical protein [Nanoarchaeota archaeon]